MIIGDMKLLMHVVYDSYNHMLNNTVYLLTDCSLDTVSQNLIVSG